MSARTKAIGLALGPLLALSACGLPQDKEPQAFGLPPPAQQALASSTTTTRVPTRSVDRDLYYVRVSNDAEPTDKLVAIRTPVKETSAVDEPKTIVEALKSVPSNAGADVRSRLSDQTQIESVNVDNGLATVNLSSNVGIEGPNQDIAIAQIVFTLTALPDIQRVRFLVRGEPARTARGDSVTREDFDQFNADVGGSTTSSQPG